MPANEDIVRSFIGAWPRMDVEEITGYFAPGGVYHNIMLKPVAGHDALRVYIGAFLKSWTAAQWDIVNIVAKGDVVIAERVDRIKAGDRNVDLPCCGVFEMQDGKIKVWRDYFDMATYAKAMTPAKAG
jgi:limonene-1,2-epoxide hydrolase